MLEIEHWNVAVSVSNYTRRMLKTPIVLCNAAVSVNVFIIALLASFTRRKTYFLTLPFWQQDCFPQKKE